METAPFYNDLADGPENVTAYWRQTRDGLRLRVTHWPAEDARGTILLFSGRTEYAEKYGRVVHHLVENGFNVVTIDWRGQGLSERTAKDARVGHIDTFADYQTDVSELVQAASELGCATPWFMIAHSMGGCIGLRALIEGLAVEKAVFSAPMWGINMPTIVQPLPYILPPLMRFFRKGEMVAPGTTLENYVLATAFEDNMLTSDHNTFLYLTDQATRVPEFALGGPSMDWVGHAASETRRLRKRPRPDIPVLTFLGRDEEIVSTKAIHEMHANWPSAKLCLIDSARHEIMMEGDPARADFLKESLAFFAAT